MAIILLLIFSSASIHARSRPVQIGVYDNAPMVFRDKDGKISGYSVEILEYIAGKENWDLEYVFCDWPVCLDMLEKGQTDMQVYIAYSKERALKYDFTQETLIGNWGVVYTWKGSGIETILDLVGKKAAILSKAIHAHAFKELVDSFNIRVSIIEVADHHSGLKLVHEKKADAVIVNRIFGLYAAKNYTVEKTHIIFDPIEIRYALPKDKNRDLAPAIDKHLRLLKADKKSLFYTAFDKSFGFEKLFIPQWIKWLIAAAAGAVCLLLIIVFFFRRQTRKSKSLLTVETQERKEAENSLRMSEDRFKAITTTAIDSVFCKDKSRRYTFVNSSMAELFGCAEEDLIGKTPEELFDPDAAALIKDVDDRTFAGEEVSEIKSLRINGKEYTFFTIQVPLEIQDGTVLSISGIVRNITDLINTQRELKDALGEKEVLLRELYHRTKNNMQIISSMLFLQFQDIDDDKITQMLSETQNRIQAMGLVHQKLYRSKDLSKINLKEYILELTQYVMEGFGVPAESVILTYDIANIFLVIDTALAFGLVLNELITNSFKHAFPDERKREIHIFLAKTGTDEVEFNFSDNGVGFPDGFDYKNNNSFGFQIIHTIVEKQLRGEVSFEISEGVQCRIRFKDSGYKPRV
ncbi:MAG: transporter substrate-binding domain-containing protein [bacterium]|nr:transporter substrate-binding domain-containing protein [bacterium]